MIGEKASNASKSGASAGKAAMRSSRVGLTMTMLFNGAIDASFPAFDMPRQAVCAVRASTERQPVLSRAEAEYLFLMDRTGQIGDQGFVENAVRAVRDHLVFAAKPHGQISEMDADWLIGMVGDRPTAFGRAVVFAVVRSCAEAPSRLAEIAMRGHVGRCLLV
jgi:hypothetical protein